jgi:NAD(P)-dependent dehydrogenase (short-subunit alcohol dehydrogenase family)
MLLENQVAIVTGSASGIGKACVTRMSEAGAAVVVADVNGSGATQVADDLRQLGRKAAAFEVDVADEAQVKAMIDFAQSEFGDLSILHNNAGPNDLLAKFDRDLVNLDADMWDRAMAVALRGVMLGSKHAVPVMVARGSGAIVNTSSVSGIRGQHHLLTHQASKAGINALTRAIATLHGKDGIRCNAILPGWIQNPAKKVSAEREDVIMRHTMSSRVGEPDDIAHLAVFLCSDKASFINGQEIAVDGGYSCHEPATVDLRAGVS